MDDKKIKTSTNSTYPKGGVSCSLETFVVNQTLVLRINPVRMGWFKSPPSPSRKPAEFF